MSKQVTFNRDWRNHKKGSTVHLREKELTEAIRDKAIFITTDVKQSATIKVSHQSKESSDGNPQIIRPHKRIRR